MAEETVAPAEEIEDRGDDFIPEDDEETEIELPEVDEEPAPEPVKEQGRVTVPKARLDEEIEKKRKAVERADQLERELAALRTPAQAPATPVPGKRTSKEIHKEWSEAYVVGAEGTDELWSQYESARELEITSKLLAQVEEQQTAKTVEREFKAAVAEVSDKYAFLDHESDLANQEAIDEVVELRDFYIYKGDTPAQALRKAADKVAANKGVTQEIPKVDKGIGAAMARNAVASRQQPPRVAGSGERSGRTVDVSKMSDAELFAMPESELKKLRGD